MEADFVALQNEILDLYNRISIINYCLGVYTTSNCALKCHVIFIVIKYSHVNFKLKLGSEHTV